MKTALRFLLVSFLAAGCAATQPKLDATPRISKADAEKIALAKVPGGTIEESELETEHGKLVWSFDIAAPGTSNVTEVQVDAVTGEVVSIEIETPSKQRQEREKK